MKSDQKSHFQKIRNCAPLEALWTTPPLTSSSSPILDNLYLSRLHFYLLLNLLLLYWHFPTSHIHRTYDGKIAIPQKWSNGATHTRDYCSFKTQSLYGLWQCTVSYHGIWWRRNCVFVSGWGLPCPSDKCPSLLVSKGSLKSIFCLNGSKVSFL